MNEYVAKQWENGESGGTYIDADSLNHIEHGVSDNRQALNNCVMNISYNDTTNDLTFTYGNGRRFTVNIQGGGGHETTLYGFHIDGNESDPSQKVTYLESAIGLAPAHMNFASNTFDYGGWENIWFVQDCKPCILNQDGTVATYLNKNNYSQNTNGESVAIDDSLVGANVMIEFPKIWYKVVPDDGDSTSASVYFSPTKYDNDFKDYAYIDHNGRHKEHFYMPAYNGSLVNDGTTNVMRSISGQAVASNTYIDDEINACIANGDGWYVENAGEAMLINFLLIMITRTTDIQGAIGTGIINGGSEFLYAYRTGAGNTKGMFWGSNYGSQLVKVFGIENWWGLEMRRRMGDYNYYGTRLSKLCWSTADGSTVFGYNLSGEGYVDVGATPQGDAIYGSFISKMRFTNNGMYNTEAAGTAITYYCAKVYVNNGVASPVRSNGSCHPDVGAGPFYGVMSDGGWAISWDVGCSVSYR